MMKRGCTTGKKDVIRQSLSIACLLLFFHVPVFAQTNKYVLLNSYPVKGTSVSVDNFGNVYCVADKQVIKYDREGKQTQNYEEYRYGRAVGIDVSNSMKLTLYYPDFMNAIVLDRFLVPIATYNFFDLGYQDIRAVGSSSDGYLWFYDNTSFTLKKIDAMGKVQLQSQPVNQLINKVISPNYILEKNGQVYVNDSATGILVFDNFGAYYKTIPLSGLQKFQIVQDQIIYTEGGKLKSYNTMTFDTKVVSLPDTSDIQQVVIEKERIAILKSDRVDFYRY